MDSGEVRLFHAPGLSGWHGEIRIIRTYYVDGELTADYAFTRKPDRIIYGWRIQPHDEGNWIIINHNVEFVHPEQGENGRIRLRMV